MNYDYCVYDNKNEYLVTTQSCSGREKKSFWKIIVWWRKYKWIFINHRRDLIAHQLKAKLRIFHLNETGVGATVWWNSSGRIEVNDEDEIPMKSLR